MEYKYSRINELSPHTVPQSNRSYLSYFLFHLLGLLVAEMVDKLVVGNDGGRYQRAAGVHAFTSRVGLLRKRGTR